MPSNQAPSRPGAICWRANQGRTTPSISKVNTSTQARLKLAAPQPEAWVAATIKANMHHAVASPSAAQAIAVWPSGLCVI